MARGLTHAFPDGMIKNLNAPSDHWKTRMGCYDGYIEVSPVVVLGEDNIPNPNAYDGENSVCEVVEDAENAHFWSAYLHMYEGGVDCIGDFTRYEDAHACAFRAKEECEAAQHSIKLTLGDIEEVIACIEQRRDDVREMAKYGDYTEQEENEIDARLESLAEIIRAQREQIDG